MGWTIESTADPMAAGIAAARGGQDAAAAAGTNFGLQTPLKIVTCKNNQFVEVLKRNAQNLWVRPSAPHCIGHLQAH